MRILMLVLEAVLGDWGAGNWLCKFFTLGKLY